MKYLYLSVCALFFSLTSFALNPITGGSSVCQGGNLPLSNDTPGGTWSSGSTTVATIDIATGVLYSVTSGTTVITYSTGTGSVTANIIVSPLPFVYSLTGGGTYCSGGPGVGIGLNGSQTGVNYQLYSGGIAIGSPVAGIGSALSFGPQTAAGPYTVYAVNAMTVCAALMSASITVTSAPPPAAFTTTYAVCAGLTTALSNAVAGGIWSSTNTAVASIDPVTGIATGNSAGLSVISYTIGGSCTETTTLTVNPAPAAITGTPTICVGSSSQLSSSPAGGTWSISTPVVATIGGATGLAWGVTPGITTISYTIGGTCTSSININVYAASTPITGPAAACVGTPAQLSNATPGGTWSSSFTAVATVDATGIVTGVAIGTTDITYTAGCATSITFTINPYPTAITGTASVCPLDSTQLSDATPGGNWSSNIATIATVNSVTGRVIGVSTGVTTISYGFFTTGCYSTITYTVTPAPSVTALATQSCGGVYTLTAGGATTYSWSPATGLSCSTCATTTANPSSSASYTVTGSGSACAATASAFVNSDRIFGHITYTGAATDSFRVWLIHYTPADSSVTAMDSAVSCMNAGTPYYQFNAPSGSYMVKAKLFGTVPGTSGYIPTYGLSSATWNTAGTVNHTAGAADSMHINMIFGTVPSGPGFIGGNVYSGAGRGTTGEVPVEGMLIYLKNTATNVLTYVYTDAAGGYAFSNLGYGDYVIYPEEYDYYTTPSSVITLSPSAPASNSIHFKQHTDYGTITPFDPAAVTNVNTSTGISIFPNPAFEILNMQWHNQYSSAADITITDITGRDVYHTTVNMNTGTGVQQIDLSSLTNGLYVVAVKSAAINYNAKIQVLH